MKDFNLIIDFDSTFVKVEALEKLAGIALNDRADKQAVLDKIANITRLGMDGRIAFDESLEERLKLIRIRKSHILELIDVLKKNVTGSIKENAGFFRNQKNRAYIVSGGFVDFIWPVARDYGFKRSHILANNFIFGDGGEVRGFDHSNPLSKAGGKALTAKKMNLKGKTYVVGDGYTDYEIKKSGIRCVFVAFTENIKRKPVMECADFVVDDFNQFLYIVNNNL